MSDRVVVIKQNLDQQETWRYDGKVLERDDHSILIEAFFNRADLSFHGILFAKGDRFLERYWSDRWYNIFEIHDLQDDHVKGWYCNLTRPAVITEDRISYVDLALDLLVYPDGRQLVLDDEEYAKLPLMEEERSQVAGALEELKRHFKDLQLEGK